MANLQLRIDSQLRDQAQAVAANMGLDLTSAVRMFLVQMVRENSLPFRPSGDPFYGVSNQAALKKSMAQLQSGQTVTKTIEELESMGCDGD